MSDYPKRLAHPNAQKARVVAKRGVYPGTNVAFIDYEGTPDRLPPVVVNNADQEAQYRAQGYVPCAQGDAPMTTQTYHRFPMYMSKPDGQLVMVNNEREEKQMAVAGFSPAGNPDPEAFAEASTNGKPVNYVPQEYPKWVGDRIVQSKEEEDEILGARNALPVDEYTHPADAVRAKRIAGLAKARAVRAEKRAAAE